MLPPTDLPSPTSPLPRFTGVLPALSLCLAGKSSRRAPLAPSTTPAARFHLHFLHDFWGQLSAGFARVQPALLDLHHHQFLGRIVRSPAAGVHPPSPSPLTTSAKHLGDQQVQKKQL